MYEISKKSINILALYYIKCSLGPATYVAKNSMETLQTFNFLRRNFSKCSPPIKASAYLTLVPKPNDGAHSSSLGFTSAKQHPGYRAAHWVMNHYNMQITDNVLLHNLKWPPLYSVYFRAVWNDVLPNSQIPLKCWDVHMINYTLNTNIHPPNLHIPWMLLT